MDYDNVHPGDILIDPESGIAAVMLHIYRHPDFVYPFTISYRASDGGPMEIGTGYAGPRYVSSRSVDNLDLYKAELTDEQRRNNVHRFFEYYGHGNPRKPGK